MSKTKWNQPRWLARLVIMTLAAVFTLPRPVTAAAEGITIFASDFQRDLAKEWKMVGGSWALVDGCLKQTDGGPADPKKALILVGKMEELSGEVVVTAKLRIDSWNGESDSRAGVSIGNDPETGRGYGLVFHRGKLEFIQDFVVWGAGCDFPYRTGKWYWLKLSKSGDELNGKAWADGDPEPVDWMVHWAEPDDGVTGYPGLDGGAMGGAASLSFAEFRVEKTATPANEESHGWATLNLNGTWQVLPKSLTCIGESGLAEVRSAAEGWMEAQVPGEIHLDLVKAGKMPEPTLGTNMPQCRWPANNSWWYRMTFYVGPQSNGYERESLNGTRTIARTWASSKSISWASV